MSWRIVERRLGRAGGPKQRAGRQREWDSRYGDQWAIGYVIEDSFVRQEEALETVYYRSYEEHFERHPEDLEALIATAKSLRNPHAAATGGVDLQVPAIEAYLRRHDLALRGDAVVDIGSWDGGGSHALSIRLSPLTIACAVEPARTLEQFWQRRKVLAVWED